MTEEAVTIIDVSMCLCLRLCCRYVSFAHCFDMMQGRRVHGLILEEFRCNLFMQEVSLLPAFAGISDSPTLAVADVGYCVMSYYDL